MENRYRTLKEKKYTMENVKDFIESHDEKNCRAIVTDPDTEKNILQR